jgi:hypothetical protein
VGVGVGRRRRSDVAPTPPPSAFRNSAASFGRRVSEGTSSTAHGVMRASSQGGYFEDGAEWDEDSFVDDYGRVVGAGGDGGEDSGIEIEGVVRSLGLALDDDDDDRGDRDADGGVGGLGGEDGDGDDGGGGGGGSDSDSSLDLHTPLP